MKHFTSNKLLMQINNGIWWKMTYLEGMDQQALNPNLDTYFLNQSINSVDSSMVNAMVTYKLSLVYSLQNLEKFWQIEANGNEKMQEESPILSYEKNSFVNCSCRKTLNAAYLNDCLINIPPQANSIASILLRFRLSNYAVATDIE